MSANWMTFMSGLRDDLDRTDTVSSLFIYINVCNAMPWNPWIESVTVERKLVMIADWGVCFNIIKSNQAFIRRLRIGNLLSCLSDGGESSCPLATGQEHCRLCGKFCLRSERNSNPFSVIVQERVSDRISFLEFVYKFLSGVRRCFLLWLSKQFNDFNRAWAQIVFGQS